MLALAIPSAALASLDCPSPFSMSTDHRVCDPSGGGLSVCTQDGTGLVTCSAKGTITHFMSYIGVYDAIDDGYLFYGVDMQNHDFCCPIDDAVTPVTGVTMSATSNNDILAFIDSGTGDMMETNPATSSAFVAIINGGDGDDNIVGSDSSGTYYFEQLNGDDGGDTIDGGGGNDVIHGGNQNDTIDGGDGNDFIYGDANIDTITAGNGNDQVFAGNGVDYVSGEGGDFDQLHGDNDNDVVCDVSGSSNVLTGDADTDKLWATSGTMDCGSTAGDQAGGGATVIFHGGVTSCPGTALTTIPATCP